MRKIIAIALPAVPLFEAFLAPPYFSPKYELGGYTLPLIQAAFLFMLIYFGAAQHKKMTLHLPSLILVAICVLSTVIMGSTVHGLMTVIPIFLAYVLVFMDFDKFKAVETLNRFVVFLLLIAATIYLVRFGMKSGDTIATRSGANIYGANAVINLLLLGYLVNVVAFEDRKDWLWLLALLGTSTIFISRSGLVISAFLILTWAVLFFAKYRKQVSAMIVTSLSGALVVILFADRFLEAVLGRFGLAGGNVDFIVALERLYAIQETSQRGLLWAEAARLIERFPFFGVGLGEFQYYGTQSSAHNIVLNNFAELGILFGFAASAVLIAPMFLFHKICTGNRLLYVYVIYLFFVIHANSAGQKLVQASGYVSGFFLIFFFTLFSLLMTRSAEQSAVERRYEAVSPVF